MGCIVSCKLHGLEDEKVRQATIGLLKPWKISDEEGCTLLFNFDSRTDFRSRSKDLIELEKQTLFEDARTKRICEGKQMLPEDLGTHIVSEHSLSSTCGSGVDGGVSTAIIEAGMLDDGNDYLCTTLSDLLFGLEPLIPTKSLEVVTALEWCYKDDNYKEEEDIFYIDVRGMCADEVKEMLIVSLHDWDDPPSCLKVIVGCKVHGIGLGKLKKTVIALLKLDGRIDWIDEGSVISIKLNGENYPFLKEVNKTSSIIIESGNDGTVTLACASGDIWQIVATRRAESDKVEALSEAMNTQTVSHSDSSEDAVTIMERKSFEAEIVDYEKRPLCTVACDLLFGMTKPPDQSWNENMTKRILSGFEKCCRGDSGKYLKSENSIDLRGWSMEEAIDKLIKHLEERSGLTSPRCLDVIVGCMDHGVGEGRLKQAVIALLKFDQTIEFDKDKSNFMITINLDGSKDYSSLKKVPRKLLRSHFYDIFDSYGSDLDDCTIDCQLIFGPRSPDQFQEKMTEQVLGGSEKCNGEKIVEGNPRVEFCGRSCDVLNLLHIHLDCWSRSSAPEYLNFIIGCKLHGLTREKLRLDVLDILKEKSCMVVGKEKGGSTILINFDDSKDM